MKFINGRVNEANRSWDYMNYGLQIELDFYLPFLWRNFYCALFN